MNKKSWIIFGVFSALYVAALIILTPYDFQITSSLYKEGILTNQICEVVGPLFMPFFAIFACVSLIIRVKPKSNVKKWFLYLGLGFVYIYAFFMGMFTLKYSYAPYLFIPAIVLYVLFTVLTIYINLKILKEANINKFINLCLVFLTVSITSLIITDLIKLTFSRGRFQEILSGEVEYHPWYYFTWRFKLNSSFPSGHTTRAGTALCFGALIFYKTGNKYWTLITEILALIFTIGVAVSRLFEGMHFATDILTAFYLITVSYYLSKAIFLTKNNK